MRAGATSVDVLPGPARKAPKQKPPAQETAEHNRAERKPAERKATVEKAQKSIASKAPPPKDTERRKPRDTRLLLSIPRLGIQDVAVRETPPTRPT